MRLLVVADSAPEISRSVLEKRRIAAHPPGPGFGRQPPSVQISTRGRLDSVGMLVPCFEMEIETAQILDRILARYQRISWCVVPVVEAGKQEAHCRTLTKHRQRRPLRWQKPAHIIIAPQQRACLGDVAGII